MRSARLLSALLAVACLVGVGCSKSEQTYCPIMTDQKIKVEKFTNWQGRKIYFCCNQCITEWEADPSKYSANLPN